jgi:hypothetical protein
MPSNRLAYEVMALFFVVSREYRHVYDELRGAFRESPDVAIVLDRRFGDRRRQRGEPPCEERRKAERRQPPDDRFASIGWRIVRRS